MYVGSDSDRKYVDEKIDWIRHDFGKLLIINATLNES